MNHSWQQPIRPLEVYPDKCTIWCRVLFIRPMHPRGWEVIVESGNVWTSDNSCIRDVAHID